MRSIVLPDKVPWTFTDSYSMELVKYLFLFFIFLMISLTISLEYSVLPFKWNQRSWSRSFTSYYVASPQPPGTTPAGRLRIPLLQAPTHLGHFSSRVNRIHNEDRYCMSVLALPTSSSLAPRAKRSFDSNTRQVFDYSIFDGHGGSECSEFLAENLVRYIEECDLNSSEELESLWKRDIGGYWTRWRGQLQKHSHKMKSDDDLQLRLPLAFLRADYDFTMSGKGSGSTCTSVFLFGENADIPYWASGKSRLTVAHIGDTKCILCDKNGRAHALTYQHHPSSPGESARLRRYTTNFFTDSFGEERFGNVENTRSFGDRPMKQLGVSAEPEVTQYTLGSPTASDGFGGDEPFLVLVSDGVTNFASDQEIVDIVTSTAYRSGYVRGTPQDAAREVVQYAEDVGGDDNATCLVVRLSGWGQWTRPIDRTGDLREYRLREALDKVARRQ
ncbi:phosphatase 2C-like domain-containing protein [Lipomyces japonicus]|uniref:phosphatase 2C-like domain-containing protein n=1 Tax=Lipomyces japonicus TaxID=56871 RepID=UPI0034CE17EB